MTVSLMYYVMVMSLYMNISVNPNTSASLIVKSPVKFYILVFLFLPQASQYNLLEFWTFLPDIASIYLSHDLLAHLFYRIETRTL